jgi:hypothetical protein
MPTRITSGDAISQPGLDHENFCPGRTASGARMEAPAGLLAAALIGSLLSGGAG